MHAITRRDDHVSPARKKRRESVIKNRLNVCGPIIAGRDGFHDIQELSEDALPPKRFVVDVYRGNGQCFG